MKTIYLPPNTPVQVSRRRHGDLSGESWSNTCKLGAADLSTDYGTIDVKCIVTNHKNPSAIGETVEIINGKNCVRISDEWEHYSD